jgi:hypothetical protein
MPEPIMHPTVSDQHDQKPSGFSSGPRCSFMKETPLRFPA